MQTIVMFFQVVVALGLLNVWLLRFNQSTAYRGGNARSMPEEFATYGLPSWSTYVVGALKVGAAICLIAGLWMPVLVLPAALLVSALMLGALAMHLKVNDPWKKSVPALSILLLCAVISWGSWGEAAGLLSRI
ncbi:MAG: DoxX family protein [Acidobacteria bacterium]|nr:DoxX family protein [Acidobacteriota bacterium]